MPINLCGIFPIILCVFDFDVSAYVSGGTWVRAFVHNNNNNNNVSFGPVLVGFRGKCLLSDA